MKIHQIVLLTRKDENIVDNLFQTMCNVSLINDAENAFTAGATEIMRRLRESLEALKTGDYEFE
jgi:hypothetical protein